MRCFRLQAPGGARGLLRFVRCLVLCLRHNSRHVRQRLPIHARHAWACTLNCPKARQRRIRQRAPARRRRRSGQRRLSGAAAAVAHATRRRLRVLWRWRQGAQRRVCGLQRGERRQPRQRWQPRHPRQLGHGQPRLWRAKLTTRLRWRQGHHGWRQRQQSGASNNAARRRRQGRKVQVAWRRRQGALRLDLPAYLGNGLHLISIG
mmetsp:Transcript_35295/g.84609  ORF Transcript_35295/g.84609 Transcript_35295/m.84609 type:complete len:205 (+) Transcript_35295:1224-1838(+)